MKIPQEILAIIKKFEESPQKFEVYLVGGCVRDLLLSREPKDWDLTTNATPSEIQKLFPKSFYENQFGTVSVITDSEKESLKIVEITPFRLEGKYSDKRHPDEIKFAKTLKEDLARRDFTINAMALQVNTSTLKTKLIDYFGGEKDLKDKIIRAVGDPEKRFNEDALRLMRAVRCAVELDFEIEEKTQRAIVELANNLAYISRERIRDELIKILMCENAAKGIQLLYELKLLPYVIKELEEGVNSIGVTKKLKEHIKYEKLTTFEHLLKTLDYAAKNNFNLETRLAALLHDIAKPRTKEGEGLEATFKGHERLGAKMVKEILMRLHFSNKVIDKVVKLVRWHFFFYDVDKVTPAGVRRLIRNVGAENIDDLLKLREADRSGSGLPKISSYRLRHLRYMIEKVKKDPIEPKMLEVKGNDVMEILNIPPSPKVGWVLNILLEEVLEDPQKNKRDYLLKRIEELKEKDEGELQKMAEEAKRRIEAIEEDVDQQIRKKYNV
ncbi:MAG: CCA tRNA nucleotidyltransferase [Patescibacteria group bacterium]|nr:CCA tRNA nucleotidyltransferase [Patescibacteria group bacterium]